MDDNSPALLVGRYELNERIAGGGMGQVWRATDQVLRRTVAIKVVDLTMADDTLGERFRREAIATAGLNHPNIVHVYDAGADEDQAFLVMELLDGPSLHQRIADEGPLPLADGLQVAREVARGLLAAHEIGVVHRDIKPGNVMFHGGRVKLVDFGIAQLSEKLGATLTAPATALGTAAYMSPEQATGEGATQASDWYALGCLLMTVFTGEPPFRGDAVTVATQQVDGRPPRLRERRPELPVALDVLIDRMLAKDPAQRPSGRQIIDQVRALEFDPNAATTVLATSPTSAMPAAWGDPDRLAELEDEQKPKRRGLIAAVLAAVVAVTALTVWFLTKGDPQPVATPAPVPPAVTTPVRPPASTMPTAAPQPTTPAAAPSKGKKSATPTPTPSSKKKSTPTPTPTSADSLAGVPDAIANVSDSKTRSDLQKAWNKSEGESTADRQKAMAEAVAKATAKGQLTPAEAEAITAALGGDAKQ